MVSKLWISCVQKKPSCGFCSARNPVIFSDDLLRNLCQAATSTACCPCSLCALISRQKWLPCTSFWDCSLKQKALQQDDFLWMRDPGCGLQFGPCCYSVCFTYSSYHWSSEAFICPSVTGQNHLREKMRLLSCKWSSSIVPLSSQVSSLLPVFWKQLSLLKDRQTEGMYNCSASDPNSIYWTELPLHW